VEELSRFILMSRLKGFCDVRSAGQVLYHISVGILY
jgi:hypothetical protein